MTTTAVILTGGAARRFSPDGADKTSAPLLPGGPGLVDELLGSLPPDWPVVVAGPERPIAPPRQLPVTFVLEDPPGGGPVSAVVSALALGLPNASVLVVLGGDMPFAGPIAVRCAEALIDAPGEVEAVLPVDADGRRQPLAGAYRVGPLRGAIALASQRRGVLAGHGVAVRDVVDHLVWWPCAVRGRDTLDVDTPEDLRRARDLAAGRRRGRSDVEAHDQDLDDPHEFEGVGLGAAQEGALP